MSKVCVLKLTSGDELVARTEVADGFYVISDPRVFQVIQTETGGVSAGLVPWILSSPDATCELGVQHVMCKIDAPLKLEQVYLQQTSRLDLSATI